MKITQILLLLSLALMFSAPVMSQKDKDQEKYKQRTLSELSAINRENAGTENLRRTKLEERTDFISYDLYFSRVRVQFIGSPRPLTSDHQELMKNWARLQNADSKVISLYENEFLFKECDTEYWIPMQKKIGEEMLKKIKPNEMVTLYIINLGGRKAAMATGYEWLFLSTAFEK